MCIAAYRELCVREYSTHFGACSFPAVQAEAQQAQAGVQQAQAPAMEPAAIAAPGTDPTGAVPPVPASVATSAPGGEVRSRLTLPVLNLTQVNTLHPLLP